MKHRIRWTINVYWLLCNEMHFYLFVRQIEPLFRLLLRSRTQKNDDCRLNTGRWCKFPSCNYKFIFVVLRVVFFLVGCVWKKIYSHTFSWKYMRLRKSSKCVWFFFVSVICFTYLISVNFAAVENKLWSDIHEMWIKKSSILATRGKYSMYKISIQLADSLLFYYYRPVFCYSWTSLVGMACTIATIQSILWRSQ